MRHIFRDCHRLLARAAIATLSVAAMAAQADVNAPVAGWLLPQRIYGSTQQLPGERWDGQLTGERSLALQPGMEWQTSTDLRRTRFEQMFPARAQGFSLSTGPLIRLGAAEFSLPWSTGRDTYGASAASSWNSGAPRMTVMLGPNDRVRLEAKVSRRRDGSSTQRRRSTSLSWRHRFSNDWSLTTGLREVRESSAAATSVTAETFASLDASISDSWRWSLGSRLSDLLYSDTSALQAMQRDRSASVSLSTRYQLPDGWWISGELTSTQTYRRDMQLPVTHAGGLKLYRDF